MIETLVQQFFAQSHWEVQAVLYSLAYVHFATKQHLACWPFALLSTGLYTWLFWETNLFFQSLLNGWYLLMAVYGWFNWRRVSQDDSQGVTHWPLRYHAFVIAGLSLLSLGVYYTTRLLLQKEILFLDLLIAVFSAAVTYMLAQKVLENWLYWVVINLCTAWLCWQQGLLLTSVLFIVYVAYAVKGYLAWRGAPWSMTAGLTASDKHTT